MPMVQTLGVSPVSGIAGRWSKLKLEHAHVTPWNEARAAMLWAVPSFSDIWIGMMADKDGELAWFTDRINTCATDDKFLYINPKFYFKLTLDEKLFVNSHEIMHAMFGHSGLMFSLSKIGHIAYPDGVKLDYNGDLLNCAMDYVINDQLVRAKIGKMPEGGLHWPALITGDMSVVDAYRLLWKEQKSRPKRPGHTNRSTNDKGEDKGEGTGKSFDELLEPGKATGKGPNKAISERSQSEWDTVITAAMESAKLRGQLPASLERLFGARLKPKADWRDLYQLAVSRRVGNDRYSWDRLDQQLAYRYIGAPGRTAFGCNLIVIAVDTSRSITQKTLDVFMAETTALLEQAKPKQVIICQCDTKIHEWREASGSDDMYQVKLKGGGGTDFRPVFERVNSESEEPDLMIYLTDLDGSFPYVKPSYPVIWGSIGPTMTAPWGEVVMIPAQHEEA